MILQNIEKSISDCKYVFVNDSFLDDSISNDVTRLLSDANKEAFLKH